MMAVMADRMLGNFFGVVRSNPVGRDGGDVRFGWVVVMVVVVACDGGGSDDDDDDDDDDNDDVI